MAHLFTREEIQKVQDKEGCTWQEAQRIMAWKKGLITVWDEDLKPGTLFVKKEDPRCQVIFLKKTKDNLLCAYPDGRKVSLPWVDPKKTSIIRIDP